ncbi:MAG: hemerythrin domain-containing protein [Thermaerobacter sp.]|jgi:hemerythrin-like domain-containing protein|nr:hemerythrin domain-containing protein [Thermaerobacter sp.]
MNILEDLMNEHRTVLGRLNLLEEVEAGDDATWALETVRGVAEFLEQDLELHLQKEEKLLFPALAQRIGEDGPIRVMLAEHVEMREGTKELGRLGGQPELTESDLAAVGDFVELVRGHIDKEDHILFPIAQRELPGPVLEELGGKAAALTLEEAQ